MTYEERVERGAVAILAAMWSNGERQQHIYRNDARDAIRASDELMQQLVSQFEDDVPLADSHLWPCALVKLHGPEMYGPFNNEQDATDWANSQLGNDWGALFTIDYLNGPEAGKV